MERSPKISFHEKKGWKGILSKLLIIPIGLLEPVSWRNMRWIIINKRIIKGKKKWREKNRDKVALSTEKPPQIQKVILLPK